MLNCDRRLSCLSDYRIGWNDDWFGAKGIIGMKWGMYLAGIIVGGCFAFFVERARSISKLTEQARQTQVAIQELQALRGEMHATQQELWRR